MYEDTARVVPYNVNTQTGKLSTIRDDRKKIRLKGEIKYLVDAIAAAVAATAAITAGLEGKFF